jgi:hypothetical protein
VTDIQASQGILEVRREKRFLAYVRTCGVLIDGNKIGEVGSGQSLQIPMNAGDYSVQVRLSWVTSAPQPVTVRAGQKTSLTFALPRLYEVHRAVLGPFWGALYFEWFE